MSSDTGYATLKAALQHVRPGGWAVEFGVYSGQSIRMIAERMPVIGFDSFKGLPEDWRPGFKKGKFAYPGFPVTASGTMLVHGWFEDTVPGFPFPTLNLVHIDCDLYSSTVTALEGVAPHISEGTVIVFDEFHGYPGCADHEMKAWEEFCDKYSVLASTLAMGPEEIAFRIDHITNER